MVFGKAKFDESIEIKKAISEGGYGEVYMGVRKSGNAEKIAIKKAIKKTKGNNSNSLEEEWIALKKKNIQHPNIVKYFEVYTFFTEYGVKEEYGIMEFLDGITLKEFITSQYSNPTIIDKLLLDILKGIKYLHEQGIIHYDISPDNIMVISIDDNPVAKIIDISGSHKIQIGKSVYMSPEYREATNTIHNKNTDLWSFAVIVYEIFTGEQPYKADQNFLTEPIPRKIFKIPEPYRSIIIACLVQNFQQRINRIDTLIDVLTNRKIKILKRYWKLINIQKNKYTQIFTNFRKYLLTKNESYKPQKHTHETKIYLKHGASTSSKKTLPSIILIHILLGMGLFRVEQLVTPNFPRKWLYVFAFLLGLMLIGGIFLRIGLFLNTPSVIGGTLCFTTYLIGLVDSLLTYFHYKE